MKQTDAQIEQHHKDDAEHLQRLGYPQELRRVLGFFDNFSVAFSYLSPMVGVYSLFVLGVGTAGPSYIWLMVPVVGFMLLVALVFGELASHYPIAGALYQYGKRTVGPVTAGGSAGSTGWRCSSPWPASTPGSCPT
jgi:amino acid transporter